MKQESKVTAALKLLLSISKAWEKFADFITYKRSLIQSNEKSCEGLFAEGMQRKDRTCLREVLLARAAGRRFVSN